MKWSPVCSSSDRPHFEELRWGPLATSKPVSVTELQQKQPACPDGCWRKAGFAKHTKMLYERNEASRERVEKRDPGFSASDSRDA